ncbi:MAG: hypothetical protein E7239_04300 [Sarcina sp.]|nr:hypothetical protein [Sarcina sp.]
MFRDYSGKDENMKRRCKQRLCIILAVLILTGMSPVSALASDGYTYGYKTASLAKDTWVTSGDAIATTLNGTYLRYTYGLYKISVPAGVYTKIDAKAVNGQKTESYEVFGAIYKTIKNKKVSIYHKDNNSGLVANIAGHEGRHFYYLKKGVYYIHVDRGMKIRWSYTKPSVPGNFCRAKAIKMNFGEKKLVFTNYGYEFDRWFKIDLPSKRSINISVQNLLDDTIAVQAIMVYRSNGKYIGQMKTKITSKPGVRQHYTSAYPKGTYYLQVSRQPSSTETESYSTNQGRLFYMYLK